jgi:hypothetical protein
MWFLGEGSRSRRLVARFGSAEREEITCNNLNQGCSHRISFADTTEVPLSSRGTFFDSIQIRMLENYLLQTFTFSPDGSKNA